MATLLIVEDDDTIRDALAWVFSDLAYHVVQASTGAQAYALLTAATEPWIVLLDRMLPQMSGDQVLVMLRQRRPPPPRHHIIVLTVAGPPLASLVIRAMRDLGAEYYPKTCEIADLIARVERVSGRLAPMPPPDSGNDRFLQ